MIIFLMMILDDSFEKLLIVLKKVAMVQETPKYAASCKHKVTRDQKSCGVSYLTSPLDAKQRFILPKKSLWFQTRNYV